MANVLIIDDDRLICQTVSNVVKNMGQRATSSFTLKDGLKTARSGRFDVVFLDVRMPDGNGLDILPAIRETSSSPEVIILTGYGDPDGAELAIKNGAWDYIQKPSSLQAIKLPLARVLQYRQEMMVTKRPVALKRNSIVGKSPKIEACLDIVAQAASGDANVLITGETGTGKELFAWAIHANSPRSKKNFVVVDCAALPETLVESVLFGHVKGAFTGADRSQDGLIKQADGGTLFLDEVGELPLSIQKNFLRVLQERRFRPVGGNREVKSDFRLVAATNRDIDDMVKRRAFRDDLLFRLRSLLIELPPLKEICEDIKELAMHYLTKLSERHATGMKGLSPEIWDVFAKYHWPGNVRELIQALERALVAAQHEPVLFPKHLPSHIRIKVARASVVKALEVKEQKGEPATSFKELPKLQDYRESAIIEAEQQYLKELMSVTSGNIKKACGMSGISRSRFYALLKKYRISKSDCSI